MITTAAAAATAAAGVLLLLLPLVDGCHKISVIRIMFGYNQCIVAWQLQYCLPWCYRGACCKAVAVGLHQQLCQAQRCCCFQGCEGLLLLLLLLQLLVLLLCWWHSCSVLVKRFDGWATQSWHLGDLAPAAAAANIVVASPSGQ
jgi:hypothetical protein